MPVEATSDRLRRIVVMVPWVMANDRPTVEEVCSRFNISRDQLIADLDLLLVCGLPPFGPGDLIEAFVEGDHVSIRMAEYLQVPPRLTQGEAIALLVMGRAVVRLPALEEARSLRAALDKLSDAVSPTDRERALEMADRIAVELDGGGVDLVAELRSAIRDHQRLAIKYFSEGRGKLTARQLDPWLVFQAMGHWYVVGLDHASGEERTFRVDRIKEARPTGASFESPPDVDPSRYGDAPVFTPSSSDSIAVVEAAPTAGWIAEFIPAESVTTDRRGWLRIELRTSHLAWLIRLLLSAGGEARAVEPPELVEGVRETARAALASYGPS